MRMLRLLRRAHPKYARNELWRQQMRAVRIWARCKCARVNFGQLKMLARCILVIRNVRAVFLAARAPENTHALNLGEIKMRAILFWRFSMRAVLLAARAPQITRAMNYFEMQMRAP